MKMIKANLELVLAALLVLSLTSVSFAQQELFEKSQIRTVERPQWAPSEIIVKFHRSVSDDVIRQTNQRHGSSTLSISKRGQFRRLRIPKNKTEKEMVAIYSRNPNVEYAEQNFIASALMVPNDPYYPYQWHLDNPVYGGINMQSAWDIETGDISVIVAVIDTGVAYENYEELVDNPGRGKDYWIIYQQAPDLVNTNFVAGFDFVNNDEHSNDDEGHGTHVTGTIAQSTNNALGVAGIAFGASIMPIKVLDSSGSGTYADIADGIYFAADNGAAVINLSLGGTSASLTLENALAYAYNKGVTIICAAGNEYEKGNPPLYPAAYDAYCIAVGATTYDEARAYYSNTGSYLDISAPGGDLYADLNGDGYGDGVLQQTFGSNPTDWGYWFYQGTSMASPHVAGVAALLISNGITGPENVRDALESTAEDKGSEGWDPEYGWGIVNATAALNYETQPVHDIAVTGISAPSWCVQGDTVSVVVSVANQGGYDESFTVTLTDITAGSVQIGTQSVSLPAEGAADLTFNWNTAGASLGDHVLLANANPVPEETDTADNAMTTSVTVQGQPVHDVAVLAIDAPLEAYQGDLISVSVTAQNQGTYPETTTLSLTDTTDNVLIDSQSVSISPGASETVLFDWDTAATGASIADHILEAQIDAVVGETDTADNFLNTTVTINEKSTVTMHVDSIEMSLSTKKAGKNIFTKATATVTIVDASGSPVEGATVYGSWSGAASDTDSGVTDSLGKVTLSSDGVKNASGGTTFIFTVGDVVKSGWIYDQDSNVENSDSISVP